jgi:hypothetical protein
VAAAIGDVAAEVHLGRWIEGREPDGVDAEAGQVIEVAGDAVQVADAVTIGVAETARIDARGSETG